MAHPFLLIGAIALLKFVASYVAAAKTNAQVLRGLEYLEEKIRAMEFAKELREYVLEKIVDLKSSIPNEQDLERMKRIISSTLEETAKLLESKVNALVDSSLETLSSGVHGTIQVTKDFGNWLKAQIKIGD